MLRVEMRDSADTLILRLEGRFTGDDAEQTRTLAGRFAARGKLLVDLTEVVFIDAVGEEVLSFIAQLLNPVRRPQFLRAPMCASV